jgi:hypothetical protein
MVNPEQTLFTMEVFRPMPRITVEYIVAGIG